MKLSKAKLIKLVKPKLLNLGYTEFKSTKDGAQGFFCKKLNHEFYLTLGLTIHRFYDSYFTGDFYLSTNTVFAAQWGDIPSEIYNRPSFLLTDEERTAFYDDYFNTNNAKDIWFDAMCNESMALFFRMIELVEPRFTNQPELLNKIKQSQTIKTLSLYAEKVKQEISKNKTDGEYAFLPSKEVDDIPMLWFKAAEKVLKDNKGILDTYAVIGLASDAYRQYELDKS